MHTYSKRSETILSVARWLLMTVVLAAVSVAPQSYSSEMNVTAQLQRLLEFQNGTPVSQVDQWPERREEIRALMLDTFIGTYPNEVPAIVSTDLLEERIVDDGSTRKRIRLTFATKNRASFEIRVWVPNGDGPFPLLMTAPRYYQLDWAKDALARGYMVCLYPGVDQHHTEKGFVGYDSVWKTFRVEYPEATWTEISCKGWLAGRALDHILDPVQGYPIVSDQIGIIGHSRYGKQSMIAAAFDERITAVVARSPGSPASSPYRYTSRDTYMESPSDFPSPWFLEKLKKYNGREDELPIDAHGWYALIAPRHLMIHTAHHDGAEATYPVEQGYLEGRQVYGLLGAAENCRVMYRGGSHNPITPEHRTQNIDWFDFAFGRGNVTAQDFPEEFIHRFDWTAWKDAQPRKTLQAPSMKKDVRNRIQWVLGKAPKALPVNMEQEFIGAEDSKNLDHDRWAQKNTVRIPVNFGDGVRGNIYYNPTRTTPAPVVIWLHPYSYSRGYNEGYGVEGTTIYHRLAQEGYAVLAFDQVGFGLRLLEGTSFYEAHPEWSRFGRMVYDVRSAVNFVVEGNGKSQSPLPTLDGNRVYVVGYSMGGLLGLHAAALDERISGVASFSGFIPFRSDTDEPATGGLRRLWEGHALLPKLGLFRGNEQAIPYDVDDLYGLIAPRPCLVVSPLRDRKSNAEAVTASVKRAYEQQTSPITNLVYETPDDINRFQRAQQDRVLQWLKDIQSL